MTASVFILTNAAARLNSEIGVYQDLIKPSMPEAAPLPGKI